MEPNFCYTAKVIRVIDGDTYDVEVDLGFRMVARMPLRLAHVDAPERTTTIGRSVTSYLSAMFGALPCPVVVHTFKPIDKYGRYLADVYVSTATGSVNLAEHLVELGFAKPYEGGKKE